MSNIVESSGKMVGMIDANATLEMCKGCTDDVIVIGWDRDGDFYYNSNIDDGQVVLWLLELAKKKLLEAGDDSN